MENREAQIFNNEAGTKKLESLREEIKLIKGQEDSKETEEVHFKDINLERLDSDDINIYSLLKDKELAPAIFAEYKNRLNNSLKFAAWIGNLLNSEENVEWFDPESYELLQKMKARKENAKNKETDKL